MPAERKRQKLKKVQNSYSAVILSVSTGAWVSVPVLTYSERTDYTVGIEVDFTADTFKVYIANLDGTGKVESSSYAIGTDLDAASTKAIGGMFFQSAGATVIDNIMTSRAPVVFLPGDANGDGIVSAGDYASVQSNFGDTGEPGIPGDANLDGVVSASDFASIQANYGTVAGSGAVPTPEPATLSLLTIGGTVFLRRRK